MIDHSPSGEPLFVLRGSDPFASGLVQLWAERAYVEGLDPDLIRSAHQHAMAMRMWPKRMMAEDTSATQAQDVQAGQPLAVSALIEPHTEPHDEGR